MHDDIVKNMAVKMERTLEHFKQEISALRTGRATISLLDGITAEYYGQPTPLNQLATLAVVPPNMIVIQPWDKTAMEPIQKAITQSALGIAPIADKDSIRLTMPALSEERRAMLVKTLNQHAEEARIAVRREREDALRHAQKLKEDGEMKEDDFFRTKNDIQKTVDEFTNEKIKGLRDAKEQEILRS